MGVYSFLNVTASIVGPNGSVNIGVGAGNAKEGGIRTEMSQDVNTMDVAADGKHMHSQSGDQSGRVIITLLKTSAANNFLAILYYADYNNPATWGKNTITIRDLVNNDLISARFAAFQKLTPLVYAEKGGTNEWAFQAGKLHETLGAI
jgi:hypothetical protein